MFFKKAFNPEAAIMKNRKKYLEPKKLTAFRCFKWVVKMQRCVASGEPIWNEQFVRPQIPAHEKKCYFLFFAAFTAANKIWQQVVLLWLQQRLAAKKLQEFVSAKNQSKNISFVFALLL